MQAHWQLHHSLRLQIVGLGRGQRDCRAKTQQEQPARPIQMETHSARARAGAVSHSAVYPSLRQMVRPFRFLMKRKKLFSVRTATQQAIDHNYQTNFTGNYRPLLLDQYEKN